MAASQLRSAASGASGLKTEREMARRVFGGNLGPVDFGGAVGREDETDAGVVRFRGAGVGGGADIYFGGETVRVEVGDELLFPVDQPVDFFTLGFLGGDERGLGHAGGVDRGERGR